MTKLKVGHWILGILLLLVLIIGFNVKSLIQFQLDRYLKDKHGDRVRFQIEEIPLGGLRLGDGVVLFPHVEFTFEEVTIDYKFDWNRYIKIEELWLKGVVIGLDINNFLINEPKLSDRGNESSLDGSFIAVSFVDLISVRDGILNLGLGHDKTLSLNMAMDAVQNDARMIYNSRFSTKELDLSGTIGGSSSTSSVASHEIQFDIFLDRGKSQKEIIDFLIRYMNLEGSVMVNGWDKGSLSGLIDSNDSADTVTAIADLEGVGIKFSGQEQLIFLNHLIGTYTLENDEPEVDFGFRTNTINVGGVRVEPFALKGHYSNGLIHFQSEKISTALNEELGFGFVLDGLIETETESLTGSNLNILVGGINHSFINVEPFEAIAQVRPNTWEVKVPSVGIVKSATFWLEDILIAGGEKEFFWPLEVSGDVYNDMGSSLGGFISKWESQNHGEIEWTSENDESFFSLIKTNEILSTQYSLGLNSINSLVRMFGVFPGSFTRGKFRGAFEERLLEDNPSSLRFEIAESDIKFNASDLMLNGLIVEGKSENLLNGFETETSAVVLLNEMKVDDWSLSKIESTVSMVEDTLLVNSFNANFEQGHVVVKPFRVDLKTNQTEFDIIFSRIDGDSIFSRIDDSKFKLKGLLDGRVQLGFDGDKVIFRSARWILSENQIAKILFNEPEVLTGVVKLGNDKFGIEDKLRAAVSKGLELSKLEIQILPLDDEVIDFQVVFSGKLQSEKIILPVEDFTIHNRFIQSEIVSIIRDNLGFVVDFN